MDIIDPMATSHLDKKLLLKSLRTNKRLRVYNNFTPSDGCNSTTNSFLFSFCFLDLYTTTRSNTFPKQYQKLQCCFVLFGNVLGVMLPRTKYNIYNTSGYENPPQRINSQQFNGVPSSQFFIVKKDARTTPRLLGAYRAIFRGM
jgi:hypothetical protein